MSESIDRRRSTDTAAAGGLWPLIDRIGAMDKRLHERIDRLEASQQTQIAVLREEQKTFAEKLTDTKSGLLTPLIVDVALLKDSDQRRNWFTRTAAGAAVTALVMAVWSLLTGK